jgi:hypothetical protein
MAQAISSRRFERLRPPWARPTHPVYQREIESWSRSRGLRRLRIGSAPLAFLIFLALGSLCGLTTIDSASSPQERLLIWSLIFLGSLLVGQAFISFATGLISTALTATVISSEIESETFSLLRVTGVPTNEIVLAKYAATLRQLVAPLAVIVAVRLVVVVGAVVTLDFAMRMQGIDGGLVGTILAIPPEFVSPTSIWAITLTTLGWMIFFTLLKPVISIALYASVGLFASSITRTRINGIITSAGLRLALVVLRAIADQILLIGSQVVLGFTLSLSDLGPWLETLLVARPATVVAAGGLLALGSLLVTILWRGGVAFMLVRATVRRAYRLPYE